MDNWQADSQLVRDRGTEGWNLAIGEPHLLREVMTPYYPRTYPADLAYPDLAPDLGLMTELRKRHPEGHIVVTNGAKQALHAAIDAFMRIDGQIEWLVHKGPHWPSYPTIASLNNLEFSTKTPPVGRFVTVQTAPNNPDGAQAQVSSSCDIWDAAYADHDLYGWNGVEPNHTVSVWSAGKLLGSPGVRVGWLVTQNPEIAKLAARYVEQTTSGVATTSQYHVAATMRNVEGVQHRVKRDFRVQLFANRAVFFGYLEDHIEDHSADFDNGMFAWFKPKDPAAFKAAIDKLKILMVDGAACGCPGFYRASLGLTNAKFHSAVLSLVKELEK